MCWRGREPVHPLVGSVVALGEWLPQLWRIADEILILRYPVGGVCE